MNIVSVRVVRRKMKDEVGLTYVHESDELFHPDILELFGEKNKKILLSSPFYYRRIPSKALSHVHREYRGLKFRPKTTKSILTLANKNARRGVPRLDMLALSP